MSIRSTDAETKTIRSQANIDSAAAQLLLKSLAHFIQEVASASSVNSITGPAVSNATAPVHKPTAAEHNLIAAMRSFIHESVRMNTAVDSDIVTDGTTDLDEVAPTNRQQITLASQGLPPVMVQQVYGRVFNEMPIRLLSFNSTGENLQLLERNMIAEHIMSKIPREEIQMLDEEDSDYAKKSLKIVKQYSSYAILSHTWIRNSPGDVVFGGWSTRELNSQGNAKIMKFCEIAAVEHNICLGWMDTVCINKESSSELDESIRSMYRWYKCSAICIAYLAETSALNSMQYDSWFTRGWTLQELLAPQHIMFYNNVWKDLASPLEHTSQDSFPDFDFVLVDELKHVLTALGVGALTDGQRIEALDEIPMHIQYQINKATSLTRSELLLCRLREYHAGLTLSRIMQLAASRKVTRDEDRVYSLMGLLDVGIPVAYGEGEDSAFARLIREIITSKPAFTEIFNHGNAINVIPIRPADFASRSTIFDDITIGPSDCVLHEIDPIEPMVLTHIGIRMTLLLVPAFLKSRYGSEVPATTEPQTITASNWVKGSSEEYILLNNGPSTAAWIEQLGPVDGDHILFVGVMNFSKYNIKYVADSNWLCIFLQTPGSFKIDLSVNIESKETDLLSVSGPVAISRTEKNSIKLTWDEIQRLGMSIATIYAR